MSDSRPRIEVMHGVNLDMLGRRDPDQYGTRTLEQLQASLKEFSYTLDVELSFFQSNFEGEFVEHLHSLTGKADGILLNPGAWTHYSWAIHDALEIAALPACEVHLSDVMAREPWRRVSVVEDLCVASFAGRGVQGYLEAIERLDKELRRR
jgi:3-dehydroquinate dehydratase II